MFFFPSSIAAHRCKVRQLSLELLTRSRGHHLCDVNEVAPLSVNDAESDEGADENASNDT